MALNETVTGVTGLAELKRMMHELPARIEGNITRSALRAGQAVVLKQARLEVPAESGALRRSLRIRFDRKAARRGVVRVNLVAGDATAWYAHLVEYGTASFYTGSGRSVRKPYVISAKDSAGKRFGSREKRRINHGSEAGALYWQGIMVEKVIHPGSRPKPFMRTAIDKAQAAAIQAVQAYFASRVPQEVQKLR